MPNIKYRAILLFLILIFILNGCINSKRDQINNSLGIKIPDNSKGLEYYEARRTSDSKRPYNKYIKFSIDSIGLSEIIAKMNLVSSKNNFEKDLCLESTDKFFIKKFWSFDSGTFIEVSDLQKIKLNWWDISNQKNILLYASFYKETGEKKTENCYLNKWDGRILLGYSKESRHVYIFIEVLMEDVNSL